jgi:hypothetical protein
MKTYMETLYSLRKVDFNHICLPHTADLNPSSIIVDGKPKLEDYIKYREDRDKAIIACFKSGETPLNQNQLYDMINGSRNLQGPIKEAAFNNLRLHLDKLIKEGHLVLDENSH